MFGQVVGVRWEWCGRTHRRAWPRRSKSPARKNGRSPRRAKNAQRRGSDEAAALRIATEAAASKRQVLAGAEAEAITAVEGARVGAERDRLDALRTGDLRRAGLRVIERGRTPRSWVGERWCAASGPGRSAAGRGDWRLA